MSHLTCCVVSCQNNGKNSDCKFYTFPSERKAEQRGKWIAAVRRINPDGSAWYPKPWSRICSEHFVGNKRSEEQLSPSWIPSIFPSIYLSKNKIDHLSAQDRHNRYMKRRAMHLTVNQPHRSKQIKQNESVSQETDVNTGSIMKNEVENQNSQIVNQNIDWGCQVNIDFSSNEDPEKTFICDRIHISGSSTSDAGIQTTITVNRFNVFVVPIKKFVNKKCGTQEKYYTDKCVGSLCNSDFEDDHFIGVKSVKSDTDMLDLAGVSINNFKFLIKKLDSYKKDNFKVSLENRFLIFLMKIKTGLSFSALGVLFCKHRTTISRIFYSILNHLSCVTENFVFWPDKGTVQGTMPKCFYPNYSNTRVIIDCTEFRIETPANVDERVFCYSHYKKGFTAKLLLGITPSGFICFKSKVAGGRKSDSQMTIESGLIDLLENGDVVLADKGFPEIKKIINKSGKNAILIMPPFLERKKEFSKDETDETYRIAKVRIHVERIMQRLRTYQILNKIPENLFHCIDDIIHICCVLVNLQPPIISEEKKG